jgi:hypothetical protein
MMFVFGCPLHSMLNNVKMQVNATATTILDLSKPTSPKLKCLTVDELDFATSDTKVRFRMDC